MRKIGILLASLLTLTPALANTTSGETPSTVAAPTDEQIVHLLNRVTMGARPGDTQKVRELGIQKFLQAQMQPSVIAESPLVVAQVQRTPQLKQPSSELMMVFFEQIKKIQARQKEEAGQQSPGGTQPTQAPVPAPAPTPKVQIQEFGRGRKVQQSGLFGGGIQQGSIQTRLVRAVESPRQLQEVMTDFWYNHFNIAMSKGVDRVLVGAYEEQAIRPYLMGNFRDLLGATMHHPAMMFYLDNAQNTKDGFQTRNPNDPKKGINENYARELLELHTLGVDGGYTQKDVQELARVLTGWTMPPVRKDLQTDGGYWAFFDQRRHDFGDKVVLGQTIHGTGKDEIEQVLDMLARHPSTARHISYQLAQYFVSDQPPQSLVDKLATKFSHSRGDIKAVLTSLFDSPEFWDPKYRNCKFKNPYRYTISALRATNMHLTDAGSATRLQGFLTQQGQPLYQCLTPDGYKNTKETWLNANALLKRMDFAVRLGSIQNLVAPIDYRWIMSTVNGGKLSAKTQEAIAAVPDRQKAAALLGSPEFMQY